MDRLAASSRRRTYADAAARSDYARALAPMAPGTYALCWCAATSACSDLGAGFQAP